MPMYAKTVTLSFKNTTPYNVGIISEYEVIRLETESGPFFMAHTDPIVARP